MAAVPNTVSCPTCQRPVALESAHRPVMFPFCSQRCRNRDLAAWSDGTYVVPGQAVMVDDDAHDERDG